jgi:hypothetical protein
MAGDGVALAVATAANAALLALALAFGGADQPAGRAASVWTASALLAVAAGGILVDARGQLLYALPAAWLMWLAARGDLERLAVRWPRPRGALTVGAGVGLLLGGHLLLTATRTLGYGPRRDGALAYLGALAYDAGANVPATELFFRGVVFDRLQRRASLVVAVVVATAATVARYVVDPLLPRVPEVLAGALFYISLLGVAAGWLLWWSGSAVPGILAALVFFAAYRLLDVR